VPDTAIDARVRRTRTAIREAVQELAEERGFAALTIAGIARRAGIHRATFYAHYPDTAAVVRDAITRMLEDLRARQEVPTPAGLARFEPERPHPNAVRWFEHVQDNARFYRAILVEDTLAGFAGDLERAIRGYALKRLAAWPAPLAPPMPEAAVLAASSAMNLGLVRWWLEQGCTPEPAAMAVHQQRLMARGILAAIGLAPEEEAPPERDRIDRHPPRHGRNDGDGPQRSNLGGSGSHTNSGARARGQGAGPCAVQARSRGRSLDGRRTR